MNFTNRKVKRHIVQKVDENGIPISEYFYAHLTNEAEQGQEGTPLNAENLNSIQSDINSLKSEISKLKKKDAALEEEIVTYYGPLINENMILKTEVEGLKTTLADLRASTESSFAQLKKKDNNLEEKIITYYGSIISENTSLKNEVEELKSAQQFMLDNVLNVFGKPNDELEITAKEFDEKESNAIELDKVASTRLTSDKDIYELVDPETNKRSYLQAIIDNLYAKIVALNNAND